MRELKSDIETRVKLYGISTSSFLKLPLLSLGISAGFPSPALDFIDLSIDLNKLLIKTASATFYGRVKGESMKEAGIQDGDLLIIDKSLEAVHGKIAVCYVDGEFTLKRIHLEGKNCWLMPANKNYSPIKIEEYTDLKIWGIVAHVIKSF